MYHPRLILHPTDLSDRSRHAYEVATDLAERLQAALLVLYVAETLGPENVTFGEAVSEPQPAGYRVRLLLELNRRCPPLRPGVEVRHLLAEGEPAEAIQRVAAEQRCELIVMATHGEASLLHLMLGSTTERVIRTAPCPVLTTKLPRLAAAQAEAAGAARQP
jgi:nucleotide-binding universal stress UspA family protein